MEGQRLLSSKISARFLNTPPYPQTHESATPKRKSLKWTPPQKPARVDSALVSGGLRSNRPRAALSARAGVGRAAFGRPFGLHAIYPSRARASRCRCRFAARRWLPVRPARCRRSPAPVPAAAPVSPEPPPAAPAVATSAPAPAAVVSVAPAVVTPVASRPNPTAPSVDRPTSIPTTRHMARLTKNSLVEK